MRASAALIVRSAPGDERLLAAAVEFVIRHTAEDHTPDQLHCLAADPRLVIETCGSLTLLNEALTDESRRWLIDGIMELAQEADRALAVEAAEYCVMFLDDARPTRGLFRRRR